MWSRYRETVAVLNAAIERETRVAAKQGVLEARRGSFKDRTGALRGTIRWDIVGWNGKRFVVNISAPMPYAGFVESGTGPHDIWPKAGYRAPVASLKPGQTRRGRGKGPHEYVVGRGRTLRWKDANGEHFAAMVHHPGGKPYPFMAPAHALAAQVLRENLQREFPGLRSIWSNR